MIDVAIVGASGYGGGELMRWLAAHPVAKVKVATSNTYAGKPVSVGFPGMAKKSELVFSPEQDVSQIAACQTAFLAGNDDAAVCLASELVEAGVKVIDLSAAFRFRSPNQYEQWYHSAHKAPALTEEAVYGLPELHKEAIRDAKIVGNPGCYTTSAILGLAPLAKAGIIDLDSIVIDGKSGVSGAGRSKFGLDFHFAEANESVSPYKVGGTHRHTGEIEQELSALAGSELKVSFTPHLIPMTRGVLTTSYAKLQQSATKEDLAALYGEFYRDSPFVFVSEGLPATKHVLGSNMCHLGLAVDGRTQRVTVISAIDNLGKGMAGQAIQNMNLMFGLEETAGLEGVPLWP